MASKIFFRTCRNRNCKETGMTHYTDSNMMEKITATFVGQVNTGVRLTVCGLKVKNVNRNFPHNHIYAKHLNTYSRTVVLPHQSLY